MGPDSVTVTEPTSPLAVPAVPLSVVGDDDSHAPLMGELTAGCGAVVSTVNVRAGLAPVFPALSLWVACAVSWPSGSPAGGTVDHDPPLSVVVHDAAGVPDAVVPLYTLTVTVGRLAAVSVAVPLKVGVAVANRLPLAGWSSETLTPTTVKVVARLLPELPAASDCVACAV